jgi:RNA polymerase sigma factor (sigma-70 family)
LAGDASQLLQAYLARRADLVRFFSTRLKSTAAAEDLVQEIYFRVWRVDAGAIGDCEAYLYRVGWNLMLDQLRQQRRGAARDHAWSEAQIDIRSGIAVDASPSVETAVAARARLARLEARLTNLPPQMQRAFRLHKFEGLSHAETAARLGISKSAIEKHISAALKKLAEDEA